MITTNVTVGRLLGGRYRLTSPIAAGGMGEVWRADDEVLHREVAVKVLRHTAATDEPAFRERFRDEARHSAGLLDRNIAAVFDYGEDASDGRGGTAYIVMELVPGRPLSEIIRTSAPLRADDVRSILGQAALALAAAHEAGVVHRDVKPANIIVTPDGEAKLTDFGISRAGAGSGHTMTGEVLGTPEYLSPEQALGESASPASDLYALGVIAHELLTGRRPFDAGTPVATAMAQVNDPPPPLPEWVPDDLRAVVGACLGKDPARRPSDARAVSEAIFGRMPLSSLPAPVPSQPSPTSPSTRALPAVQPGPVTSRADSRTRAQRHTVEPSDAKRRGWVWLVVPLVAGLVWAAFALGSLMGSGQPAKTPVTPVQQTTPAGETMSPAATTPTTPATPATTTPEATEPVATPIEPTESNPGKGKGKGRK